MFKIIVFLVTITLSFSVGSTYTMNDELNIHRHVIHFCSKELVEVIWQAQIIHQLTTKNKKGATIAETLCIMPRDNTHQAILEIVKGYYKPDLTYEWTETKKHVIATISHLQNRGYKRFEINFNTYEKMKSLEVTDYTFEDTDNKTISMTT